MDNDSIQMMVSMGFSENDARAALRKYPGDVNRAINSLFEAPSHTEADDSGTNNMVLSEISQYSFPNGKSACTYIALSGALIGLPQLARNEGVSNVINSDFLTQSVLNGVNSYENNKSDIEHASAEELLQSKSSFKESLKLLGHVRQGVISHENDQTQMQMGLGAILRECRLDTSSDQSKWLAIIMTKSPETVLIFIPPVSVEQPYILVDSHPRPHSSNQAYATFCQSLESLVNEIEKIFSFTDLGPDVSDLMKMMYNSFDCTAIDVV